MSKVRNLLTIIFVDWCKIIHKPPPKNVKKLGSGARLNMSLRCIPWALESGHTWLHAVSSGLWSQGIQYTWLHAVSNEPGMIWTCCSSISQYSLQYSVWIYISGGRSGEYWIIKRYPPPTHSTFQSNRKKHFPDGFSPHTHAVQIVQKLCISIVGHNFR